MELIKVTDNIFMIKMKNQYQLTSTFMRLQEFYESPYESIRGNYFTVEQYMDTYAANMGNFTYNTDWNGFNVPGDVLNKFFRLFEDGMEGNRRLLRKEKELRMLLLSAGVFKLEKFYVIGVHEGSKDCTDHEMAHAYYYVDEDYKKEMDAINPPLIDEFSQALLDMGYCDEVADDEMQAYLATSSYWYLLKTFGFGNIPWRQVGKYRQVYAKFSSNISTDT